MENLTSYVLKLLSLDDSNETKANITALVGIISFLASLYFVQSWVDPTIITEVKSGNIRVPNLVLLGACLLIPILWVWSFILERQWADERYKEHIPAPPKNNGIVSIFIGFQLAVLVVSAQFIHFFIYFYALYIAMDFFGQLQMKKTIAKAITGLKAEFVAERKKEIDAVRAFYTGKRWIFLFIFRMSAQFLIILNYYGEVIKLDTAFLQLLPMVINEIFVWIWRIILYDRHA